MVSTFSFWEKAEMISLYLNPDKKCSEYTFQLFLKVFSPVGLKLVDNFLLSAKNKALLFKEQIYVNEVSLAEILALYHQNRIFKLLYIIDKDFMKNLSPFEFLGLLHFFPNGKPFSTIKECLKNMYEKTLATLGISIDEASITDRNRMESLMNSNRAFTDQASLLTTNNIFDHLTTYGSKHNYCAMITKTSDGELIVKPSSSNIRTNGELYNIYKQLDNSIVIKRCSNLYIEAFFPLIYYQRGTKENDVQIPKTDATSKWLCIIGGLNITLAICFLISFLSLPLSFILGIPVLMIEFMLIYNFCT